MASVGEAGGAVAAGVCSGGDVSVPQALKTALAPNAAAARTNARREILFMVHLSLIAKRTCSLWYFATTRRPVKSR